MLDNLEYFIDLYEAQGKTISQALASEALEIEKIRRGVRGGLWSRLVVELNSEFYKQLTARRPETWGEVRVHGESIVELLTQELSSLTPPVEAC